MRESARRSHVLVWLYVSFVLLFIYLPLLPPLVFSVATGEAGTPAFTLSRYAQMWRNPVLTSAIVTSLEVGGIVALIAPLLGLAAAMAIRELPTPRLILSLVLLPLFIPGVSAGLATALFSSSSASRHRSSPSPSCRRYGRSRSRLSLFSSP
jgi:ABC-type spermidine/putrescine transport system permease subunit II